MKKLFLFIITAFLIVSVTSCAKRDKLNNGWRQTEKTTVEETTAEDVKSGLPTKKFIVEFSVEEAVALGTYEFGKDELLTIFYQDGYVLVFNDYGTRLYELECSESIVDPGYDAEKNFIYADMNFDGKIDFGVLLDEKDLNLYYKCFLRDTENGFVCCDDLSRLANPAFDAENRTVSSDYYSGDELKEQKTYIWEDNSLKEF